MRSGRRGVDDQGPGQGAGRRVGAQGLAVCSAAGRSAPAVGSTSPTTCASRWTTSWHWPTTAGHGGAEPAAALFGYCNRVKGTRGKDSYRLKMAELRADNVATGVMIDEGRAVLTGKRLAQVPPWGAAGVTSRLRGPAPWLGVTGKASLDLRMVAVERGGTRSL